MAAKRPIKRETPSLFASPHQAMPLSVSELTAQIKAVVEHSFARVYVAGEIGDLACPASGHIYLTLKDDVAQIRGLLWRSKAERLKFALDEGMEVICRGAVEIYPPRGTYQLVIDQIEPRGIGALQLAFRQLHAKLDAEGLFDPARKRPIPRWVRSLALVTSPSGAAVRDFIQVLRRRWRGVSVLIVPTRVQGEGAGAEIAAAIARANRVRRPLDCLVLARGGGSSDDLWAFNEEVVVRAIAASRLPVVSAVGHEIDVTLADLAADLRALTPSEAAERVAPSADQWTAQLAQWQRRLAGAVRSRVTTARTQLETLARSTVFRRPAELVRVKAQYLDELAEAAARAIDSCRRNAQLRLESVAARLESLSPLGVLARGYSLTQRGDDGRVIRDAAVLRPGEVITTRFARGRAASRVESIEDESSNSDPLAAEPIEDERPCRGDR